jgi:glycosyltransferase involved in cell wall biosynthesis
MRILCVNNTADLYGASRCMERVFGRLAEAGHEVHAVIPCRGPLVSLLETRGVHVHIHRGLPILERAELRSVLGCSRFLLLFPLSVMSLAVLAVRLQIDVIHTNVIVLPTPCLAAFITGKPHIWHVRELLGEFGRLWKPYQRYVTFLSKAVVAISNCTRDQFDPALRERVHVIYDGLDETLVKIDPIRRDLVRSSLPSDKLLVGVLGRIKFHRKGQEVLVRAASLLKERYPGVHYVLVGSVAPGNEDHERRLRTLIAECGVEEQFTFYGETDDPISAVAALDIAVVPSVQPEPFGCVVIEAMAAGTPVIGSRCGGIAEQIVDGVSGLLFPPGDSAALAVALDRLLSDKSLRASLADGGKSRVRNNFSLDTTYRSALKVLHIVSGSGLAPESARRML